MELALLWHRGPRTGRDLVPQLSLLHELRQSDFLPRHVAASSPPGESRHKEVRYLDIHEDDHVDEKRFATWVRQAAAVPGYSGTNLPEGSYFDDPERLEAAAQSAKSSNEQYRITTDADRTRATFSNSEILSTTARATSVENDPSTYLAGESMGGTKGTCVPLPPATGSAATAESSGR